MAASRNDCLVCRRVKASLPVSVERNGFALPVGFGRGDQTTFLTLDVEATARGLLREPFIELRCGGAIYRQYFEPGASGRRQLNLSPVFQGKGSCSGAQIELRSHSLRWRRDGVLTTFDSPSMVTPRVLVLAPHPDDAEIAAFGFYADHAASAWVATITAGEQGAMSLAKVVPPPAVEKEARWKASLRVSDSLTVPRCNGVAGERALNLVYPDGELENMYRQPTQPFALACEPSLSRLELRGRNQNADFRGEPAECTWANLVAELRILLDRATPDVVICPHPLIDLHPDHVFTTVALEEALRQSAHRVGAFFLYVVHAPGAHVHPFGPANGVVSVAPWSDGDWIADAIHSYGLNADLQRAKYFAIDAHHDLRAYTDGEPRTFRQLLGAVKREVSAAVRGVAVEANESVSSLLCSPERDLLRGLGRFAVRAGRATTAHRHEGPVSLAADDKSSLPNQQRRSESLCSSSVDWAVG